MRKLGMPNTTRFFSPLPTRPRQWRGPPQLYPSVQSPKRNTFKAPLQAGMPSTGLACRPTEKPHTTLVLQCISENLPCAQSIDIRKITDPVPST
jgi:hypothetical protein